MTDRFFVTTSAPDAETAKRLADSATAAGLATVTRVHEPVAPFCWHTDEPVEVEEWRVTFETTADLRVELEAHLVAEHPADNPVVTVAALRQL
jgi:periplasmic divalent cation tolerance protein